ncbi:phosphotransferase [Bacillus sp. FJAT-49711]|uniref:aminoglycoside phosphotransferase family protein n=1 Tax=Bacillus sp. FJAT-49711 TaxID=2833585 RepID=UPI001BC900E3|nr:aminoglycoside phosphotransferase family protein [Bacillus sp. FJAT-49711]MBS4218305.1 phosphotransferase [Bacillus sp. FJAT-49711]
MKKGEAPKIELVKHIVESFFKKKVELERVKTGVSTYVYRIQLKDKVSYLRILPEQNASFAVEVKVHELLITRGVKVPKIIHFEQKNDLLQLSIMIAEEINGSSIEDNTLSNELGEVLFDAGKQLALINQIKMDGYGFINREMSDTLSGEKKTFHDYYHENLDKDIAILPKYHFDQSEINAIRGFLETGFSIMNRKVSRLVHGDFDGSHIFQSNGLYTGIIDFGEIMASSPLYDVGHFKLHDNINGFKPLINGYKEVESLTAENDLEIDLWALFIGVRRLGMIYGRPWNFYHEHLTNSIKKQLVQLNQTF